MLKIFLVCAIPFALSACASNSEKQVDEVIAFESAPINTRSAVDVQRISELERQLAERQRQCQLEKRRLELALKDNQKQSEELQKKLDALLAIDRELRGRTRNH